MNAKAYTVGQNIVFGPGHYAPGTSTGNHLLSHELTHVLQQYAGGDLNTIQRVPGKSSQSMEEPSSRKKNVAATGLQSANEAAIPLETQKPDDKFAATFKKLRTGCIKSGSIDVATGISQNDSTIVTGLLKVTYEGEGRTKFASGPSQSIFPKGKIQRNENGKYCFCDCMHYRQYIRGLGWEGSVGGSANRPIVEDMDSYNVDFPLDGQWREEKMSPQNKGINQDCKREFNDSPGITELENGADRPVMLRYNFYLQIWDACQQRELWHDVRTLTIGGSMPPRSILWSSHHQPLTRESISGVIPEVNERPDRANSMHQKQQI